MLPLNEFHPFHIEERKSFKCSNISVLEFKNV